MMEYWDRSGNGNRMWLPSLHHAVLPLFLCALFFLSGCFRDDCACTDLFAISTVTVVDSSGSPVDSLQVSVRNTMTRAVYDVRSYTTGDLIAPGVYVVFHDGLKDSIHVSGDDITITFLRDSAAVVTAEYVFGADQCHCHITKMSGPDTVIAFSD